MNLLQPVHLQHSVLALALLPIPALVQRMGDQWMPCEHHPEP